MAFSCDWSLAHCSGQPRFLSTIEDRQRSMFATTVGRALAEAPGSSSNPNSKPQLHMSNDAAPSSKYGGRSSSGLRILDSTTYHWMLGEALTLHQILSL